MKEGRQEKRRKQRNDPGKRVTKQEKEVMKEGRSKERKNEATKDRLKGKRTNNMKTKDAN